MQAERVFSLHRIGKLAAVFYRLGLVESYGTGIRKILRLYEEIAPSPIFHAAEGAFRVELPNRNERPVKSEKSNPNTGKVAATRESAKHTILQIAREQDGITRKEVEDALHISTTRAFTLLKQLCEDGELLQNKNGNQTSYRPAREAR